MSTTQAQAVGLNLIELDGGKLLTLLEGVITHASKDKSLTALNAVQLQGEGGDFTARATDRYRLIEGSVRVLDGQLDAALISLDDAKRLIALVKAHKAHLISLNRLGDALTVSSLGDAVTFTLLGHNYPDFTELFNKTDGEPVAVENMSFNPAFMADYAKIAGKGEPVTITFTGESKPVRVKIAGDAVTWRALLMPMRIR